jgi:hypothetical protein
MRPKVRKATRAMLSVAIVVAVIALAMLGQRLSPPQQGPSGAQSGEPCKIEAIDGLQSAANHWCANGLFAHVVVSGDKEHVVAVAQLSSNGAQVWQIQNAGLMATFPGLTDKMAAAAGGRSVSVSVHDAADRRVATCARMNTDAAARCDLK